MNAPVAHPMLHQWPVTARDALPQALWTAAEIAAVTGGTASADFQASGVEMDSRDVKSGDVFIALKGEAMDGHKFIAQAFEKGAVAAIVDRPVDYPHVLVKDTTRVSWAVSIPGIFHVSFWFIPNQITTSVIWTASGSGVSLLVGFDAVTGSFFLVDLLFNRIVVPYPVNVSDRICLGVCQTATERRLFVGKMGGEVQSASKALAPTAGYTALKLY